MYSFLLSKSTETRHWRVSYAKEESGEFILTMPGKIIGFCENKTMQLFVNAEIFDHAIVHSSVKWTVGTASSLVEELKISCPNRAVTLSKWLDASSSRLSVSESQAYWSIFITVKTVVLGQVGDWIDLATLGILLVCQAFPNVRARAESFHRTEVMAQTLAHPVAAGSTPSVPTPTSRSRGQLMNLPRLVRDSSTVLSFVHEVIPNLLCMASLNLTPDNIYEVTSEQVEKLRILFHGDALSLSEILLGNSSSAPSTEIVDHMNKFLSWDRLLFPSFDLLDPIEQAWKRVGCPKETVYISNHMRAVLLRSGKMDSAISSLYIVNCSDTSIYIAEEVQNVSIIGCIDCEIYLMAVTGSCTLSYSDKVVVRAVTRSMRIENSTDCFGYIYTTRSIVLTGDTRGITLAPFNVLYSAHESLLRSGTFLHPDSSHATIWAQPICCTLTDSPFTLLPPSKFRLASFPELRSHAHLTLRVCIPQLYADALKEKEANLEDFRHAILAINDEVSAGKVNSIISGHFREWVSSNKSRAILDLVKQFQPNQ